MKYIYILPIILFSCENKKENNTQLIEFNEKLNEKNEIIQQKIDSIKFFKEELKNCKMNYKALDDATN